MQTLWNNEKNKKLIAEQGLSLEKFASFILEEKYIVVLKNSSRKEQKIFIIPSQGYTYVVPFVIDKEQNIILKTVFPSRKYHALYGGKNENENENET